MKAYIGKYRKTGSMYLVVKDEKKEKYYFITKQDYPFLVPQGMKRISGEFDLKEQ